MNPVFIQLRQARKEKKLTLQMVAQRLAIDVAILSKMERGMRPISEKQLKAFCKLYQLDFFLIQKTATAEEIIEILKGYDDPQEILKLAESQLEYVPTKKINMNEVVPTLKRIFKKFPSLQSAWIFGSFARGEHRPTSDIDILIDADHGFSYFQLATIQHQAQEKLKTKIDIGFRKSIQPTLMKQIEKDLILIYERT